MCPSEPQVGDRGLKGWSTRSFGVYENALTKTDCIATSGQPRGLRGGRGESARPLRRSGSWCGLVASHLAAGRAEEDSVQPRDTADGQRNAMLRAIHEREGGWDEVDPDPEVARIAARSA